MISLAPDEFTLDIAKQMLDSDDEYPIDFELAWKWLGYSSKQKGQRPNAPLAGERGLEI